MRRPLYAVKSCARRRVCTSVTMKRRGPRCVCVSDRVSPSPLSCRRGAHCRRRPIAARASCLRNHHLVRVKLSFRPSVRPLSTPHAVSQTNKTAYHVLWTKPWILLPGTPLANGRAEDDYHLHCRGERISACSEQCRSSSPCREDLEMHRTKTRLPVVAVMRPPPNGIQRKRPVLGHRPTTPLLTTLISTMLLLLLLSVAPVRSKCPPSRSDLGRRWLAAVWLWFFRRITLLSFFYQTPNIFRSVFR